MQDERQQHQQQLAHPNQQQLAHPNQQQQPQHIAQDLIVSNHPPLDMSFTMLDNSAASSFSMPQSAPVDMQHIMWDGSAPFLTDTSIFGTGDMASMSAGAFDDFDSWMRSQEGQFATPNPNHALGHSPSLSFGPLGGDQPQLQQTHPTQGHSQVQKADTDVHPKPARKERPLAPKPAANAFVDPALTGPPSVATAAAAVTGQREPDGRVLGSIGAQELEHWQLRPSTTETIAGGAHLETDPANLLDPSQVNRKNHRRNRSSLDAARILVPTSSSPLGRTPAVAGGSADLGSLRMAQRLQNRRGSKAYHRGASPEKSNLVRPGLSRSMSENRLGRNGRGPASMSSGHRLPYSVSSQGPIIEVNGSSSSGGSAARGGRSGKISPLKHQKRLSELASVREIPQFQERIRLAVNERGFAHPELILSTGQLPKQDESTSSESESDESDDEPIMLPSRNSSFALKDSRKPVGGLYHSSKRSLGGSSSSNTNMEVDLGLIGDVHDDSDAETVTEDQSGMGGDASSALKDLAFQKGQQRLRGSLSARQARSFRDPFDNPSLSLTLDEEYREAGSSVVRCVCHGDGRGSGAGSFMVQCQCCENWLHGNCINITRSTRPSVYICAFCADTGFGRANPRQNNGLPRVPSIASSPLTKKSIRSFR